MLTIPPDQQTAQESAPDEARVGRFSTGLEVRPQTPDKLERHPDSARKRHRGRFSDGLEERPETTAIVRRGSYADGLATLPRTDDAA